MLKLQPSNEYHVMQAVDVYCEQDALYKISITMPSEYYRMIAPYLFQREAAALKLRKHYDSLSPSEIKVFKDVISMCEIKIIETLNIVITT